MKITEFPVSGYERLASCVDGHYHGLIAIHNTHLGPAIGGTRLWHYQNEQQAINDLLRLARGMTYKNALAGVPFGGGKSIIMKNDGPMDREAIFRMHGRFVETFGGKYITAEDVGTSPEDLEHVRQETQHVAGLLSGSGNPSPVTARGVFRAMQAAAKYRWGDDSLEGRTIAIQGCGSVGYYLASYLNNAGANLIVSDVDQRKVERVVSEFGAMAFGPDDIYYAGADIFAPCALGGVINDETVSVLKMEIVAGAANNQLLEPRHGDELAARDILYVPDYAANSGGVINGCRDLLGWDAAQAAAKVDEIYDTVFNIFRISEAEGIPTYKAADRLAEERFQN
jgi:leucine dehydrogenase